MERVLLVTLTLGSAYQALWRRVAAPTWHRYASTHGYDVVAVDSPLDTSPRAQARSPSWQKCLVLGTELAARYDRVVWVDADVVINPLAPPVAAGVPMERIGAVDEFTSPDAATYRWAVSRLREAWHGADATALSHAGGPDYYAAWGLPGRHDRVVQGGVLVLSPRHHRTLLEEVYWRYEDRGGPEWNYEMRPLSFEILEAGVAHWLDPRFNAPFFVWRLREEAEAGPSEPGARLARTAITAVERNYFLHFASRQADMLALVPWLHRQGLF